MNEWDDWKTARMNLLPIWYMHQMHGINHDHACKGCAFLVRIVHSTGRGSAWSSLRCKIANFEVRKRNWNMNYPACGAWKPKDKAGSKKLTS